MASSLISNTNQVYFASVLAMDNADMVAMFEALVASGLNGFLDCLSDIYEAAMIEFFQKASVRDGQVISTVKGKLVEISEEVFARTFQLPVEGLMDLNEVPKDLVFDARSVFSFNGEQLSTSYKKREMKFEFRLLCDFLEKSVTVKVGSFDAVTHERFLMMTAIYGGIKLNWGRLLFNIFKDMVTPGSRQARGYAVQICILLKNVQNLELGDSKEGGGGCIQSEEDIGEEGRVKEESCNCVDEPIVKKKRTRVGKAAVVAKDSALLSVELDAVPIQTVDPTSDIPAAHPLAPKRKAPKRKLRMTVGSDDETVETTFGGTVEKEPVLAGANIVDKEMTTADEVDNICDTKTQWGHENWSVYFFNQSLVMASSLICNTNHVYFASVLAMDNVDMVAMFEALVASGLNGFLGCLSDIYEAAMIEFFQKASMIQRSDETEDRIGISFAEFAALDFLVFTSETDRLFERGSESKDKLEMSASKQPSQISESKKSAVESASVAYFVEEPIEETEQNHGTDIADAVPTADAKIFDDESMALEEHLSMIPDGSSLPSTTGEVTKIQFGKSITIRGVDEGDWYKASLPKILSAGK
ncbi:hypothetical protein F511_37278 [Dorcoceras hygrometricum]|uniref:Dystroglycan-like n=1 Tax=Dorcoceras hygrometricum TaxID=472368 RepID=A0A2Z7CI57_9LAMI|nr:hypothetical protein F511_37278 [Dorcoceras hygrometricum]